MIKDKVLKYQWNILKRSKLFYVLIGINYIIFALWVWHYGFVADNINEFAYKLLIQQLFIGFSCVFFIGILLNKDTLHMIREYVVIHVKDVASYIYRSIILVCVINNVLFTLSNMMLLLIQIIWNKPVYLELFFKNLIIVNIGIIVSLVLITVFRLLFKKDIFVYTLYYLFVLLTIVINSKYIALPLTARTYQLESDFFTLFMGRLVLFIISFILLKIGVKKFIREMKIY